MPAFNSVVVTPDTGAVSAALPPSRAPPPEPSGIIEIEFPTGGRMRITGAVEALTVSALMKALSRGKRRR